MDFILLEILVNSLVFFSRKFILFVFEKLSSMFLRIFFSFCREFDIYFLLNILYLGLFFFFWFCLVCICFELLLFLIFWVCLNNFWRLNLDGVCLLVFFFWLVELGFCLNKFLKNLGDFFFCLVCLLLVLLFIFFCGFFWMFIFFIEFVEEFFLFFIDVFRLLIILLIFIL